MPDDIDRAADDLPPEWLSGTPDNEDPDERSLLRQLAADPESGLVEIAPQVWWMPKEPRLRPDRDKLS